jgi:hypothetical protein
VKRLFYFPVAFLSLMALLLLLSGQLSRFSIPRAMPESSTASDRAALGEVTLANQQPATKDDLQPVLSSTLIESRKRSSGVGLFSNPAELKAPASDERLHSFFTVGLNQIARKKGEESSRPKNQVRLTGYRPRVNFVTRIHRPRFFERRLGNSGNGPSWQKIRSDIQRLERRITRLFHPALRRSGRYALGP